MLFAFEELKINIDGCGINEIKWNKHKIDLEDFGCICSWGNNSDTYGCSTRTFEKNNDIDYEKIIKKYSDKGYARELTKQEVDWFIKVLKTLLRFRACSACE